EAAVPGQTGGARPADDGSIRAYERTERWAEAAYQSIPHSDDIDDGAGHVADVPRLHGTTRFTPSRDRTDQTAPIPRTPPARGGPRRHGPEPVRSEPGHRRGMAAAARRPAPPGGPGASRARAGREPILAAASERPPMPRRTGRPTRRHDGKRGCRRPATRT